MMQLGLMDLHCHLDLYPDFEGIIQECEREGIYTLTVTTTPKAWPRNHDLTAKTRFVRAALGLHPQLVSERAAELSLWEEYLPQARYIGEVGLDASPRYYHSFELQKQVFERILLACRRSEGKALTVHSLRSSKIVLDMVEKHLAETSNCVILHWFTGSPAELRRAVDLGCYFSVNAQMMSNDRGQTLIASIPTKRLLTETDGPFTQYQGHPTRPKDIKNILETLAQLRRIPTDEMRRLLQGNLESLLNQIQTSW